MAVVLDGCFTTMAKAFFFSIFLLGKTDMVMNQWIRGYHMGMGQIFFIPMGQNWTTYLDVSSNHLIGVAKFDPYPCW